MPINARLCASLEQHQEMMPDIVHDHTPELETYEGQRAAQAELSEAVSITASLSDAIDDLEATEAQFERIQEDGNYDQAALTFHAAAVNRVKEQLGDEPIQIASVESYTEIQAQGLMLSQESKGVMAKAWDALVAFLKRVKDAIVNFLKTITGRNRKEKLSDLRKSIAETDVLIAKTQGNLAAFAEADKKQSRELSAMLDEALKFLDETQANVDKGGSNPFAKANPKLITTIEELDEFMLGNGEIDNKKSEAISKATAPDGDKVLEGSAKREIEGDLKIIEESDKSDEVLMKKAEKLIDVSTKIAENGKGGKAAQDAVKAAAKVSNVVTSYVKNNSQKKSHAVAGYTKRKRAKKGKK